MTSVEIGEIALQVFTSMRNVITISDVYRDGMSYMIYTTDDDLQVVIEGADWVRHPLGDHVEVVEYNCRKRYDLGIARTADEALAILKREHAGFLF